MPARDARELQILGLRDECQTPGLTTEEQESSDEKREGGGDDGEKSLRPQQRTVVL
jgi:hypothetical protein